MLLTPHVLVGTAVAVAIQNPVVAVPVSLALHFVGDMVPHWDFFSNSKKEDRRVGWRPLAVMADLITGVAIGMFVTLYALWVKDSQLLALNVFLCGIASVLPDALEGPYIYMHSEPKFLSYLTTFQRKLQFQAPLPWGIISQLVVSGLAIAAVVSLIG